MRQVLLFFNIKNQKSVTLENKLEVRNKLDALKMIFERMSVLLMI